MKKYFLVMLSLFFGRIAVAQLYLKPNEEMFFSFTTITGKKMVLAKDKRDAYLIYRYGTAHHIDMEYPSGDSSSWSKFTYSYYLRGGGVKNEGEDFNYLYFEKGGYRYIIYSTYYAIDNSQAYGVRVENRVTKVTTDIHAIGNTVKGTLIDFRYNDLVKKGEEIFD